MFKGGNVTVRQKLLSKINVNIKNDQIANNNAVASTLNQNLNNITTSNT